MQRPADRRPQELPRKREVIDLGGQLHYYTERLSHFISRAKPTLVAGQRVVHEVVDLPLVILACPAGVAGCCNGKVVRARGVPPHAPEEGVNPGPGRHNSNLRVTTGRD